MKWAAPRRYAERPILQSSRKGYNPLGPYRLFDAPMADTYISAYSAAPQSAHAVMDKIMGRSEFSDAGRMPSLEIILERGQGQGRGFVRRIRHLSDNWLRRGVEFPILVGSLPLETIVKITYNYHDK